MGLHNLLKPGPRDLVQLTREVGKCSSEVLQPHWSTTEQGKRKDHSWSTSWGQTDPETVPYKSRQGQHIKEDLSLSSKKELSISITNSPCGWIIIRFTEYFTGEKGTLAPPPHQCHSQFFLSLLLLFLYWLFSAEDGNLQSIAAQEVQNVPVIFALLKFGLLSFTTTFFHKHATRWVYGGGPTGESLQKCLEKWTGGSIQCVFSFTDLGKVT